ncbi:MAG TPA: hypothetical protein VFL31_03970 [Nitrospiraceae bacterium]|nr:hypothetical protein [Nitrospiraceae bacterium]
MLVSRPIMPARRHRLLLVSAACLIGAVTGAAGLGAAGAGSVPIMVMLALLAGFSALWST